MHTECAWRLADQGASRAWSGDSSRGAVGDVVANTIHSMQLFGLMPEPASLGASRVAGRVTACGTPRHGSACEGEDSPLGFSVVERW